MDSILFILFIALAIATVLNIFLKKLSVSHIIGYILTGTIVANLFTFTSEENLHSLELIGEFGIVFLMFTIGLEMSFAKLKKMKKLIFFNGTLQVVLSTVLIYICAYFIFALPSVASIIIALGFSLSSTAIVLTYLKKSKDLVTPYGEKTVAVLIFQDLAVIPILLLISFLSYDDLSVTDVLIKTLWSATLIIVFMFTLGKKLIEFLLEFSTNARLEELFLGAVLTIVIGASILAHSLGFTYSLGAFIAGMLIAETTYHVKVVSDISPYKDILLGAFFFTIGTKIDVSYFFSNIHLIFAILIPAMIIKAVVIYGLIRKSSKKSDAIKSAFALCQIGEFSFAIFAMALSHNLIDAELGNFLILVTVLSMILTPFIVNNIYRLASYFVVEFFEADKITPIEASQHTIVCGFSTVGRIVSSELAAKNVQFRIISDDLQHVKLARKRGYLAYFGHLEKLPVLESLKVEVTNNIIITLNDPSKKKLICQAILDYCPTVELIVKVNTYDEKEQLSGLKNTTFIHAQHETALLLVKESIEHKARATFPSIN